jgi:hypothetical protein
MKINFNYSKILKFGSQNIFNELKYPLKFYPWFIVLTYHIY